MKRVMPNTTFPNGADNIYVPRDTHAIASGGQETFAIPVIDGENAKNCYIITDAPIAVQLGPAPGAIGDTADQTAPLIITQYMGAFPLHIGKTASGAVIGVRGLAAANVCIVWYP